MATQDDPVSLDVMLTTSLIDDTLAMMASHQGPKQASKPSGVVSEQELLERFPNRGNYGDGAAILRPD